MGIKLKGEKKDKNKAIIDIGLAILIYGRILIYFYKLSEAKKRKNNKLNSGCILEFSFLKTNQIDLKFVLI